MATKPPAKVELDLSSPTFLRDFLDLDKTELARVAKALRKVLGMEWVLFEAHPGFRWEALSQLPKAPNGSLMHSMRLTQKYRALAYRDGKFLRVLSLHLDHDSAYEG